MIVSILGVTDTTTDFCILNVVLRTIGFVLNTFEPVVTIPFVVSIKNNLSVFSGNRVKSDEVWADSRLNGPI